MSTKETPVPLRRIRKRDGRCYELAHKAILFDPDGEHWRLCHGVVSNLGHVVNGRPPTAHAWIEAADYCEKHGAKTERRYTKQEAARMLIDTSLYGPWHETCGILREETATSYLAKAQAARLTLDVSEIGV